MTENQNRDREKTRLLKWGLKAITPAGILDSIAGLFESIVDDLPYTTEQGLDALLKTFPEKANETDSETDWLPESQGFDETEIDERYKDIIGLFSIPDIDDFYDTRDLYKNELPYKSPTIYQYFSGTDIFDSILEGLSILDRLCEAKLEVYTAYFRGTFYSIFCLDDKPWIPKETFIKWFGEWELNYLKPGKSPDEYRYEAVFLALSEYFALVERIDAEKRLQELIGKLRTYKRLFLDPIDTKELEAELAEHNRTQKAKFEAQLEKIPPANRTAPTTLKKLADCWGGDMTPKKLKGLIKSGRVTAAEMNRQTYVFDAAFLPESVVKAIKI